MTMKIEKYEKIGKGKYRLFLDNGEVLDTYDDVILKNELLLKKELTPLTYTKVISETTLQEYYNSCVKYISIRLRSTKEIEDYLKRKKVSDEDINLIIDRLKKNNLLDDNLFCRSFIKDKLRFTSMGEYRILNELKKHNISKEIILANQDLFTKEVMQEKISKLITKQIKTNRKLDSYKLRNKLYNRLLQLGYSSEQIIEVLNQKFNSTE